MRTIQHLFCFTFCVVFSNAFAQQFASGKLISINNDTLPVNILIPHKKADKLKHTYQDLEIQAEGGTKRIRAKQVKGYIKGNETYQSLSFYDTTTKALSYVFAKVLLKEKVNLYFTVLFLDHDTEVYFFKKRSEPDLHIFCNHQILDLREGVYKTYVYNEDIEFRDYFSWYFKDCTILTRKIQQGFYTTFHLEQMLKDYEEECN